MSTSVFAVGVRDLAKDFNTMWNLKVECDRAQCDYPKKLVEYFKQINDEGYELEDIDRDDAEKIMSEVGLEAEGDVWEGNGMSIPVDKIPKDVKFIRIYAE